MSLDRRLEYDASPPAEDDPPDDRSQSTDPVDGVLENDVRTVLTVGPAIGLGAFIAVYLVAYQLSLAARNGVTWSEGEPGTWVTAGIVTLTSHGGTYVEDPERLTYVTAATAQNATGLLPLIIAIALVAAGVLVGRVLEPSSPEATAVYAGSVVSTYVASLAVLTRLARYTPSAPTDGPRTSTQNIWSMLEVETVAVSLDASFLLTTTALAFVFVFAGATFARRAVLFPSTFGTRPGQSVPAPVTEADWVPSRTSAQGTGETVPSATEDNAKLPKLESDENPSDGRDEADATGTRDGRNDRTEGSSSDDHARYRPGSSSGGLTDGDHDRSRDDHDRYRPSND